MNLSLFNPFELLKAATLLFLAVILFSLGSATRPTSLGAYLSFSAIMLLQGLEMFAPAFSGRTHTLLGRTLILRASILIQMILASVLVAVTDGSGSIYELVYLLPIVSAATKLAGPDVAFVVIGSTIAMIGFILTGEQLTPSITHVKEFQDALAAIIYFAMAGLLTYFFAKGEREQRERYETLAGELAQTNGDLRSAEAELTERLTQVTQMEERLQQIDRMAILGEMAGQIAHEVRNPLGIIKCSVDILAKRVSDPFLKNHLGVLREETARLNNAVEGVLRLGGPLLIRREPVNVSQVLATVVKLSSAWLLPGSITILMEPPRSSLTVNGDSDLLHQAFSNLIRNACQAIPTSGAVTIQQYSTDNNQAVSVEISDQGVGISEGDLKRMGDAFFTKRQGGLGLGFSLARRVVAEHGGTVQVTSKLGKGTVVIVSIPVLGSRRERPCAIPTQAKR